MPDSIKRTRRVPFYVNEIEISQLDTLAEDSMISRGAMLRLLLKRAYEDYQRQQRDDAIKEAAAQEVIRKKTLMQFEEKHAYNR